MNRIEALCICCVALLISALSLLAISETRVRFRQCTCVNNLRIIDGAIGQFWIEHSKWPDKSKPRSSASEIFQDLGEYIQIPENLICPTDNRLAATNWSSLKNTNISYFIAVQSDSRFPTISAGGRNIVKESGVMVFLDSSRQFAWNTNSGLHEGADYGFILLDSTPLKMGSTALSKTIADIARTNHIEIAVP